MKDIQRQKNEVLLEAVKYAAEGNAARALKNITDVNELKEEAPRLAQLADRYLSLSSEQQDATLIISGTNASRKTLNDYIRGNLGLAGTGETFTPLTLTAWIRHRRNAATAVISVKGKSLSPNRITKMV